MLFRSDRKSTRLNSSHLVISYAVFCLKKKKNTKKEFARQVERWWHAQSTEALPHALDSQKHELAHVEPWNAVSPQPRFFFFFFNITAPPEFSPFPPRQPLPF